MEISLRAKRDPSRRGKTKLRAIVDGVEVGTTTFPLLAKNKEGKQEPHPNVRRVAAPGHCFHCVASWSPRSINPAVKCPRCFGRLDTDPEKCNCQFCLPRRQLAV
jgi:hypothetical protein